MNKLIFKMMSEYKESNDIAFPIWIFDVQNVFYEGKRYLKIWVFNRFFDSRVINSMTVEYEGQEYSLSHFSVSSTYDDENILGAVLPIELNQESTIVKIKEENVNGDVYKASYNTIEYKYNNGKAFSFDYIASKMGLGINPIYPSIGDNYWQCVCGRINDKGKGCNCGKTVKDIDEILSIKVKDIKIEEYINKDIEYDPRISFEDNIDRFFKRFEKETGFSKLEIENKIDYEEENKKYQIISEEFLKEEFRRQRKEKKKKRVITIVAIAFGVLIIAGILIRVLAADYFVYMGCKDLNHPADRMDCYMTVENIEGAKDLKNEAFKEYLIEIYNTGDYQSVIDILTDYDDVIELYDGRLDSSCFVDKDIEEIYCESLLMKAEDNYGNIKTLEGLEGYLEGFDPSYQEQVKKMIHEAYLGIVDDGEYSTVQYFYNVYQEENSTDSLINLEKAVAFYAMKISVEAQRALSISTDQYIVTDWGFESLNSFYDELVAGGYSSTIIDNQAWDGIRLVGTWSDGTYTFEEDSEGNYSSNIPTFDGVDSICVYDHICYTGDKSKHLFAITWVNQDTVLIKSYKNDQTYSLKRS